VTTASDRLKIARAYERERAIIEGRSPRQLALIDEYCREAVLSDVPTESELRNRDGQGLHPLRWNAIRSVRRRWAIPEADLDLWSVGRRDT
jgi:hypothetical protein